MAESYWGEPIAGEGEGDLTIGGFIARILAASFGVFWFLGSASLSLAQLHGDGWGVTLLGMTLGAFALPVAFLAVSHRDKWVFWGWFWLAVGLLPAFWEFVFSYVGIQDATANAGDPLQPSLGVFYFLLLYATLVALQGALVVRALLDRPPSTRLRTVVLVCAAVWFMVAGLSTLGVVGASLTVLPLAVLHATSAYVDNLQRREGHASR